nr:hypothetical protein [Klebsiella pneumoniae]
MAYLFHQMSRLQEKFIQSLSNKDIIVDDVVLFDMRNVLKYVLHIHLPRENDFDRASGR